MSLVDVRSYFRSHMNALSFKEWTDGFNVANIPSNILDKSYHMDTNSANGLGINQHCLEMTAVVQIKVFIKGYRTPAEAIDKAMLYSDQIIVEHCAAANRLTGNLKNIIFENMLIEPLNDTNDNSAVLTLGFQAFTLLDVES